ncbi:MAG: hypothetical protein AAFY15_01535 [Cyanobacteria bacterium J06648_11]
MSCKITIEIDGHTEQALLPVIHSVAKRYPGLLTGHAPAPGERVDGENPILLQQQIQQLMLQNQLLQSQIAGDQQALPAAANPVRALLPEETDGSDHGGEDTSQRPALPAQYQTGPAAAATHWARSTVVNCWRLLVWLCFGQDWLVVSLLLSGAVFTVLAMKPQLLKRVQLLPEFIDSSDERPGAIVSPAAPSEPSSENQSGQPPDQASQSPTTPPADPASKAGSHPPPPPAFQTEQ